MLCVPNKVDCRYMASSNIVFIHGSDGVYERANILRKPVIALTTYTQSSQSVKC